MSFAYYESDGHVYRVDHTLIGFRPQVWYRPASRWDPSSRFSSVKSLLGSFCKSLTEEEANSKTAGISAMNFLFGGSTSNTTTTTTQTTESSKHMAQNIHRVIMIQRPTNEQRENGIKDKLILGPEEVMAESDANAIAVAVKKNATTLANVDLCDVSIQVKRLG